LETLSKKAEINGWAAGMQGPKMPIVNTVTAFKSPTGNVMLLGLGGAAMDDRAEQTEALINTHIMRKNHVAVNDIAKRDGGEQRMTVNGVKIDLEFTEDKKLLTFRIRRPTEEELNSLQIHWLTPRIPDSSSELLRQSERRNRSSVATEDPKDWGQHMGSPPEKVMAKTLEATTQVCAGPVEIDNRESP
jgi:hypothetical protein